MTDVMDTDGVAEPQRPEIDPELVERLLAGAGDEVEILGPDGLLTSLTKAVIEAAMKAELTGELGYAEGDPAGAGSGNRRRLLLGCGITWTTVPTRRIRGRQPAFAA